MGADDRATPDAIAALSLREHRMGRTSTRRRWLCAVVIATLVTTTACAAGGERRPPANRELVVATTAPAPSLDPTNTLAASGAEISIHVFDALVTYDEQYEMIPNLAKSWTVSDDGLTYTFDLATGIKFHDGTTMTVRDVIASINRAVEIGVSSETLKPVIDTVRADGDHSVVLTLKQRFTALPAVLGNPLSQVAIMPAKYARKDVPLKPPELIGTGPFEISEWKPDQYTLLSKFDGYTPPNDRAPTGFGGDRTAKVQSIKWTPVTEAETRLAGLRRDEFHFAESLPQTSYDLVKDDPRLSPFVNDTASNLAFWLNHNEGQLLSNKYLRQAIVATVDADAILNVAAAGIPRFYDAESSIFWSQQKTWFDPEAGKGIYNRPDRARVQSLLDKANYDGEVLTIVTNRDYAFMYAEAVELQRQLDKVGINAELKIVDWAGAVAVLGNSTGWDMFASSASFAVDPYGWNTKIAPDGALAPGFKSPTMQRLIDRGSKVTSVKARQEIYRKVQRQVWIDVPTLIIGKLNNLHAADSGLNGYRSFFMPRFWTVSG